MICFHFIQYGWTVVHFAAYNGHLEALRELLEGFNCEADRRDRKVFGEMTIYLNYIQCYMYRHAHAL